MLGSGHKNGLTKHKVAIIGQGPGVSAVSALAQRSAKPTNEEISIGLGLAIVKHIIDAHGGKGDDLGYSSVTTVPMGDKPDLAATNAACKKRHQFAPQQKTDADFNNPSPGLVAGC